MLDWSRSRARLTHLEDNVGVTQRGAYMRSFLRAGIVAAVAATVVPSTAVAQTVDEVVARYVAARGGIEKLQAVQSLKITRTVATGIGTTVKVIIYKKRPQLFRAEQGPAQPGATMTPRGVNPDAAWDTQQGKIVTRPAQVAAETRDLDADFDGFLVDWKAKGHTVVLDGRVPMTGGDAYQLTVTLKSGLVRTVFLDAKTYLDRRHTGLLNLPGGRQFDVTIDFANWRDVDGVKFPFDITEERTGKEPVVSLVIYTDKIEANLPMDDTLFATPAK
jgi:hypothetical protein